MCVIINETAVAYQTCRNVMRASHAGHLGIYFDIERAIIDTVLNIFDECFDYEVVFRLIVTFSSLLMKAKAYITTNMKVA